MPGGATKEKAWPSAGGTCQCHPPRKGPSSARKCCRTMFWKNILLFTVDGRNPALVDMVNVPLFEGFHTCQLVQEFFHQQYYNNFYANLNYSKCCVIVFVSPMVLLNLGKLLEFLNLKYGDLFGGVGRGGSVTQPPFWDDLGWGCQNLPKLNMDRLKCPPRFSKRLLLYSIHVL